MEPYDSILLAYLLEQGAPERAREYADAVEGRCYSAICRIRAILADETLEDPDCILKIEEIVCTVEELGLDAVGRHDFG